MAGSPCPIEVMKKVVDKMGASEMTIVYGQTGASPGITQTRTEDSLTLRAPTVGRTLSNVEVKIVDIGDSAITLPPGQQGELCTRGYHVMKGYYKMPEATQKKFRDFCDKKIVFHKIPRYFFFVDEHPTTASGKIQKYKLRDQAIEALQRQQAAAIENA